MTFFSSSILPRRTKRRLRRFTSTVLPFLVASLLALTPTVAFQPNFLEFQQLLDSSLSVDQIFFAAAVLLDTTTTNRNSNGAVTTPSPPAFQVIRPPKSSEILSALPNLLFNTTTASKRRNSKEAMLWKTLEKLATTNRYDYETRSISKTILLTPQEDHLFSLLRQARDRYSPRTTIRVAGGWVRDKLLQSKDYKTSRGNDIHDIDLVIDNCSGQEFCKLFQKFLQDEKYVSPDGALLQGNDAWTSTADTAAAATTTPTATICTAKLKSDNLQTASLLWGDFDLDFAQLRMEQYQGTSRTPSKVNEASVVEDAWRRDLTINALYFNLNTNQVEDWTERGLADLQLSTISTPLPPFATLLEDPLRILRAIRFASQLSFRLSPRLLQSARDPRVGRALVEKVSKDRIGQELDQLFGATVDPTYGLQLLLATKLWDRTFSTSAGVTPSDMTMLDPWASLQALGQVQSLVSRLNSLEDWETKQRKYLWYASILYPSYVHDDSKSSTSGRGSRERQMTSIVYQVLGQRLRREKSSVQSVESILQGACQWKDHWQIHGYLPRGANTTELPTNDRLIEEEVLESRWKYYQTLKQIGPLWKEALMLACATQIPTTTPKEKNPITAPAPEQTYEAWRSFLIQELCLESIFRDPVVPLLNGSEIRQVLPGLQGASFRTVLEAQEEWQVKMELRQRRWPFHASTTTATKDSLKQYLKQQFPEYE